MEHFLIKFANNFIPKKNYRTDDLYYQSVLLVLAFFASVSFLSLFAIVHISIKNYIEFYCLSAQILTFIISIFLYPKVGNNHLFGNLIIGVSFSSFIIVGIFNGGIYSSIIPWFGAVAITGFVFSGRLSGIIWSLLALLAISIFYLFDIYDYKFVLSFDPKFQNEVHGLSLVSSTLYIFLIVFAYEFLGHQKKKRITSFIQEVQEQKEELLQQKEELLAQKELIEENERRLFNILDIFPDPAVIIDKNGIITYWNKAIEELTGYSSQDMIGKGNYEYSIPFYNERRPILVDMVKFDDDFLSENYINIKKNNNCIEAESFVPNLRGEERYLISRAIALKDKVGNYTGAIQVIHDITEQKRTIELIELQKQELELLSIIASETDSAITILDKNFNFLWVNKSFEKRYGLNYAQLIEKRGTNLLQASRNIQINQILNYLKENKTPQTYENVEFDALNNKVYTQTNITPILDENNEIKYFATIDTDISKIKNLLHEMSYMQEELFVQKEDLEMQKQLLEENEKKLNNILNLMPDPAFIINGEGVIIFWNKAIEELTGYNAENMVGKGDYEYSIPFYGLRRPVLIDLAQLDEDFLKTNYSNIVKQENIVVAETYAPNLKGEEHYLVGRATALYDKQSTYIGAIEVIHDITNRVKTFDLIRKQKQDIEDSIISAQRIQKAIFPEKILFPDNFIILKPRNIVSGDFYWFAQKNDKIYIAAADCTGHGVSGAFLSILGISYLNSILLEKDIQNTDLILETLSNLIITNLHQFSSRSKDSIDIALLCFNKKLYTIDYSGARSPMYHISKNQLIEYKPTKRSVGYNFNPIHESFKTESVQIYKGDFVYIFTDGFIDQLNKNNEKFYSQNFKNLLLQASQYESLEKQKYMLLNAFDNFKLTTDQTDDVLIVGLKF